MSVKKGLTKKILSVVLIFALALSSAMITPTTVRAAGWLNSDVIELQLGNAVSNSVKTGDYRGLTESDWRKSNPDDVYWHVYKFSMLKNGILNIYIESASNDYFTYHNWQSMSYFNGFAIYSCSDPENIVWRSMYQENEMKETFSSSRAMYYGSTEISLNQGDYYFVVRHRETNDTPYYLTLSYKEPDINITSISLDKKTLKLEPGEQATVNADVLPDNATDKTVAWESSDSSIASVENGIITAHSPGTATITAASPDGEISASCTVTVIDTPAIDELEESQPTITSIQSGKRKVTVYYEPIYMDNVKYQISYKTGSGKWKIKNVSGSPAVIRSLRSKKAYSVRIRGYKSIDGSVYYSSWSKAKRVKIK